jgi:hypothetical protein
MYEQKTVVIDFKVLHSASPFKPATANFKKITFMMPTDYKR